LLISYSHVSINNKNANINNQSEHKSSFIKTLLIIQCPLCPPSRLSPAKSPVSPLKNANSLVNPQGITFILPGESPKIRTPQGVPSESPGGFFRESLGFREEGEENKLPRESLYGGFPGEFVFL
jgi:hypothetical protein